MYCRLIVCLLASCAVLGAADVHSVVPRQFRGTWGANAAACKNPRGAESRLIIRENSIDFYESRGRILGIATQGTQELALLVEATGEGQTWLDARQFTLSEDGKSLTDVTGRRRGAVRVRCE